MGLAPCDQSPKGGADIAEINSDAFPRGKRDWRVAERVKPARLEHLGRTCGVVQIDLDDLDRLLSFEWLADKADEARHRRREGEHVLSTLAMPCLAKFGPGASVRRTLESIDGWRLPAPVDLEAAERSLRAEINLDPRVF